ncbi:unnamed protein product [Amoebophrya sp. A120]|nr:unnamed protein product [Amoebophrya sp. A120]|eukprot:GSA120T00011532001.1
MRRSSQLCDVSHFQTHRIKTRLPTFTKHSLVWNPAARRCCVNEWHTRQTEGRAGREQDYVGSQSSSSAYSENNDASLVPPAATPDTYSGATGSFAEQDALGGGVEVQATAPLVSQPGLRISVSSSSTSFASSSSSTIRLTDHLQKFTFGSRTQAQAWLETGRVTNGNTGEVILRDCRILSEVGIRGAKTSGSSGREFHRKTSTSNLFVDGRPLEFETYRFFRGPFLNLPRCGGDEAFFREHQNTELGRKCKRLKVFGMDLLQAAPNKLHTGLLVLTNDPGTKRDILEGGVEICFAGNSMMSEVEIERIEKIYKCRRLSDVRLAVSNEHDHQHNSATVAGRRNDEHLYLKPQLLTQEGRCALAFSSSSTVCKQSTLRGHNRTNSALQPHTFGRLNFFHLEHARAWLQDYFFLSAVVYRLGRRSLEEMTPGERKRTFI